MSAVAERVTHHKPMMLNGVSLDVEWLKPGRPPPLYTADNVTDDALLFGDLPANIDAELLRNYASDAAGVTVNQIMFSPRPGVALVQYSAPMGLSVCLSIFTPQSRYYSQWRICQ